MNHESSGKKENPFVKRKHFRYPPNPLEVAYVDPEPGDSEFSPKYTGLIIEESAIGGCCLAILNPEELYIGKHCRIKLGDLPILQSEVRWEKNQEMGLILIGFKFLE